jgi:hypothetical protein
VVLHLDELCEEFLREYRAQMPVSPVRVALWQAYDCLRDALHRWTKVKSVRSDTDIWLLGHQLERMQLL